MSSRHQDHRCTSPKANRRTMRPIALSRPPVHPAWLSHYLNHIEDLKRLPPSRPADSLRRTLGSANQRSVSLGKKEAKIALSRTITNPEKDFATSPERNPPKPQSKGNKMPPSALLPISRPVTQGSRVSLPGAIEHKGFMDNYVMGKTVGQGAYASVKAATHKETNHMFAIKTYEKYRLLDPQRRKSVQREIRILSKLDHPNIVKLVETIDCTRQLHLVLEFVPGISLSTYLKQRSDRKLEECEAKRIFRQLLSGVEYCHNRNVTHRDLKLENVLLDEKNNVKIIDFGFATCFAKEKKVKMFCGTPSYMAPEIIGRREYCGPPADVWALGIMLYAMLCGTLPFKGQNDRDLYQKIQRGQYLLPPHLSVAAKSLLQSLLSPDPDKRPSILDIMKDPWIGFTHSPKDGGNRQITIVSCKRIPSFSSGTTISETCIFRPVIQTPSPTSASNLRIRSKTGAFHGVKTDQINGGI